MKESKIIEKLNEVIELLKVDDTHKTDNTNKTDDTNKTDNTNKTDKPNSTPKECPFRKLMPKEDFEKFKEFYESKGFSTSSQVLKIEEIPVMCDKCPFTRMNTVPEENYISYSSRDREEDVKSLFAGFLFSILCVLICFSIIRTIRNL